ASFVRLYNISDKLSKMDSFSKNMKYTREVMMSLVTSVKTCYFLEYRCRYHSSLYHRLESDLLSYPILQPKIPRPKMTRYCYLCINTTECSSVKVSSP
ncbi:unnamed protein product, partial [Heterobilharzia americana]